jgi:hypothetical protein
VCAVKPLVAFYDIHGREREVQLQHDENIFYRLYLAGLGYENDDDDDDKNIITQMVGDNHRK